MRTFAPCRTKGIKILEKIRIGGVPEHFNYPVHQAIENGLFSKNGIEAVWQDCPAGTGQMAKALEADELDVCILLTEGIIQAILKGNPSKIISGYVKTPLIWGIHTGVNNPLQKNDEYLIGKRIAISRFGSGSHLMPLVDALANEKELNEDQFVLIENIHGALPSLDALETDVFYWEKYTTKPYVEAGKLRRIGEFISPWPCFVIAATDKIIADNPDVLDKVLRLIHASCDAFMKDTNAIATIAKRYGLHTADASRWFHATEWHTDSWVSDKMLSSVVHILNQAGAISANSSNKELVWKRK
jgi:sulfonate transport system substrate-binding protein